MVHPKELCGSANLKIAVLVRLKLEDRTPEETLQQERCARRDASEMAKSIYKLKEKDKATLFSPSDVWSLAAPSPKNSEERDVAVDFGASMHMLSRERFNCGRTGNLSEIQKPYKGSHSLW